MIKHLKPLIFGLWPLIFPPESRTSPKRVYAAGSRAVSQSKQGILAARPASEQTLLTPPASQVSVASSQLSFFTLPPDSMCERSGSLGPGAVPLTGGCDTATHAVAGRRPECWLRPRRRRQIADSDRITPASAVRPHLAAVSHIR